MLSNKELPPSSFCEWLLSPGSEVFTEKIPLTNAGLRVIPDSFAVHVKRHFQNSQPIYTIDFARNMDELRYPRIPTFESRNNDHHALQVRVYPGGAIQIVTYYDQDSFCIDGEIKNPFIGAAETLSDNMEINRVQVPIPIISVTHWGEKTYCGLNISEISITAPKIPRSGSVNVAQAPFQININTYELVQKLAVNITERGAVLV